jgi:DNA-directed RNA polymerase
MLMFLKTDVVDLRKTKRAMCANIMHSIDAFELRSILRKLNKKEGCNINAIHDCVICPVFDFFIINDIANRNIEYISKPKINIIKKEGYSLYIFS